jgi:hypothetical protein
MGLVVCPTTEIATSPVDYINRQVDFRPSLVALVSWSDYREIATSPVDYINRQADFRTKPLDPHVDMYSSKKDIDQH